MSAAGLPTSLDANPLLTRWIAFLPNERVRIATGKVEIGQGIVTALAQIAAEELDVSLDQVEMLSGSSELGPDERYTTSSLSIQESGASIRLVCAEVRGRMLQRMAQRLNCAVEELSIERGRFLRAEESTGFDYWRLAPDVDLETPIDSPPETKPVRDYTVVGQAVPRLDLPAKVRGAAFIHDLERPALHHARVLRQPWRGAMLAALDEPRVRRSVGAEIDIVRLGNFVAFLSKDEAAAERAAHTAAEVATWEGVRDIEPGADEADWLTSQPTQDEHLGDPAGPAQGAIFEGAYSRGYVAHASMAPSCALAEFIDGHLTVWSHGQGMHPLRRTLADAMGIAVESITTHHAHGAGCYGHNGADDAALDAALVARARPGQCIRLQWRREEEFGFEPLGPSMHVELRIVLDEAGWPKDWTTEIWSGVHVQRPGLGGGNLLAAEALPDPATTPKVQDPPMARGGGATRNAVPLYTVGAHRVVHHLVPRTPVRTSALRGLGALPNVFAIECALDEIAARQGIDPLDYRLALCDDPRGTHILKVVAQRAGWSERPPIGSGEGLGIGMARYKNTAAYAAVIAQVAVDEAVAVKRVWCVADAGLVINPDGALNQLEGGIVQAISWTLKEQVRFNERGIASLDWEGYPILRFSEVPEIDAELVDARHELSLGVGECTVGPTAAALGNAVAAALGTRLRRMPFTRERIVSELG